ncbi:MULTISPECIES: tyrosine-type recombinase/integrase [unclassified Lebetimonas]|uniref:tyrosine-type recombinase/integrase n=1 Tax=unclassified Lebetimonas TaxID=2648158 RepID=UPI0004679449|nr:MULTISPECIES: integrase arm-type DNA-binding domain-containing protein [unclassified Lebetimonas]
MKIISPLTQKAINAAIKKQKKKITDGYVKGLTLMLVRQSYKWRLRYKLGKKDSYYTIGDYPTIGLSEARKIAQEIRNLLLKGIDPNEYKRQKQIELKIKQETKTFNHFANQFLELKKKEVTESRFKRNYLGTYIHYIQPFIGNKKINEITRTDIIEIIKQVPKIKLPNATRSTNKTYKAKEVLQVIKKIFDYIINLGLLEYNPAFTIDVKHLLPKEEKTKMKAILKPNKARELYKKILNIKTPTVKKLLQFQALTGLRNVGLYRLKWDYVDFEKKLIIYPPKTYKDNQEPFRMPLTDTLIEILIYFKQIYPVYTFKEEKLQEDSFSSKLSKYYREYLTKEHNPHGWRATFSTLAYENQKLHNISVEAIELQLNHKVGNKVTRAYMRSDFLKERRKLLEWWEEFLINF